MKNFNLLSFVLGIASGALVLFLVVGGYRMVRPANSATRMSGRTFQQGGNGGFNLSRMAQRLGMTEADLQAALSSGKTMQDIAKEKGVTLPAGRGSFGGNAPTASGSTAASGAVLSPSSSLSSR